MFTKTRKMIAVATMGAALLAGCASAGPGARGPRQPAAPYALDVLPNPYERMLAMQQMRLQILRKTGRFDDGRFAAPVRASLTGQLIRSGFTSTEADQILAWVDEARADQARAAAWWSSVVGAPALTTTSHSMSPWPPVRKER
jgi:hypothetical protein